jgi:hypothetical protein
LTDRRRLESWKAIAAHLNRSVRTVRRWEAEEELPVRRHQHGRGSTVFAFTDELDTWRDQREARERNVAAPAWASSFGRGRFLFAALVLAVAFSSGFVIRGFLARPTTDLDASSPENFLVNYTTARSLSSHVGDPELAEKYAERASGMLTTEVLGRFPDEAAWVASFEAKAAWLVSDVEAVLALEQALVRRHATAPAAFRSALALELGYLDLAMGRNDAAFDRFSTLDESSDRHESLAHALFAKRSMERLQTHLQESPGLGGPFSTFLRAMHNGDVAAPDELSRLVAGQAALQSGNYDEAIPALASFLDRHPTPGDNLFFIASDFLAQAHDRVGRSSDAIKVLEMTPADRARAAFLGSGLFWSRCQLRLAEMYRAAGQVDAAQAIEEELRRVLDRADEDDPVRQSVGVRGESLSSSRMTRRPHRAPR